MFQIHVLCSPFEKWNNKIITDNLMNVAVSFIVLCGAFLCLTTFSVFPVSNLKMLFFFFCNICFPVVYTVCIYSNNVHNGSCPYFLIWLT